MSQLSYIHGEPRGMAKYKCIPEQLKERAEGEPDREAFIFHSMDDKRVSVTFYQVFNRSQRFARVLASLGVKKGDTVLIYLHNTIEWLDVVFGTMALGAIPVMTCITKKDVTDLDYVMEITNAVGIVFTSTDNSLISGVKQLKERRKERLQFSVSVDLAEDEDFVMSYSKKISCTEAPVPPSQHTDDLYLDPDDIAIILRSSGSSGRPKLIALSHLNLNKTFADDVSKVLQTQEIKAFSSAPFSWLAGTPLFVIITGWTGVTVLGDTTLMSAEDFLKYTERESCNLVRYTHDVWNTIILKELPTPSCMQIIFVGGSPVKKNFEFFLSRVECLVFGYGTLEVGGISEYAVEKGTELKDYICGYPLPGVEIKIVGDTNETVKRGVKGKIFVRTSNLFLGYYDDDERTKATVTPSLWYNTEDFGYIADSGELYVLGRDGDSVTQNSRTSHVSEIESVIEDLNLPLIKSVLVVAVPDEISHEVICACITVEEGTSLSEEELKEAINEKINDDYYKPKYVTIVDSFPVNINGKWDRKLLAKLMTQRLLKDSNASASTVATF